MKKCSLMLMSVTMGILMMSLSFPGCKESVEPKLISFEGIELPKHLDTETATLIFKGKIRKANPAYFDLQTIMKFQPATFKIKNQWDNKTEKYTGAMLTDVLNFLDTDGSATVLDIIASNDYKASIKMEDVRRYQYILSYQLNDMLYKTHEQSMNKGPVAIAINFDKHPDMDREIYKHQLVWYVKSIVVR